ncbi:hypothetical protein ACPPVU_14985 [Mucilaginibacter sp. McL0603]|uniref:hypothetical protein n=1 Tax=Mucilaginibacter sp. McL0603 TaxID=3415670 RepID=UPI003CF81FE2
MIALPLKLTTFITELYLEETPVSQLFKKEPKFIDDCFTDIPWFFFENNDISKLEKENENYTLSSSAKRWNEIKLDIYYCFFYQQDIFRQTVLGKRNEPTKSDWEYFIHFNTKQSKKADLWTNRGYPRSYNSDTYWIDKEVQNIFFGEYNKTIDEAFINEPNTIERLLCFDKDFFFDEENLFKLINSNPNYKLSNRAILWNSEKYNCWLEQKKEEERQSMLDWESRRDAEELQYRQADEPNNYLDDENYFNFMTDGQLGNFHDFPGTIDDIDDWAGR